MRVRIWVGLVLCAGFMGRGQTNSFNARTRFLSLHECIEVALARNLDLQIEHLKADIAADYLSESYGVYVPIFTTGARHDFISQSGDFDPKKSGVDFPYELDSDTFTSSLAGRLPFGLSYNLNGDAGEKTARTDFNFNTNTASGFFFGVRQTNDFFAQAGLTARQHLLRDFWIDQDSTTIRLRRKDLKISQQALRFQVMKTILAVELAYYDLVAARENIRVQDKALELRRQLVAETRRRVEVGDVPQLESDQAETQLQNTLTAAAATREIFSSRQNALKRLLTDDFKAWVDLDLEPTDALAAAPVRTDRAASFLNAMKNRPDLIEARLAVEKNDVVVKFRFNQLFPTLDALAGYGSQTIANDYSSALGEAFRFRPNYYYGVVLSFPLYPLSERGHYRASKGEKALAELQLKEAEQDILVEVADLVNRIESRFSQVGSTRKARAYAEAALDAEQKKMVNGLSTGFFVLQLQETLTAARTAEVLALADYDRVLAQLAFAEGGILERHRLKIGE
jgi:outer membrane protein TolC